jgi:hypothetical protein
LISPHNFGSNLPAQFFQNDLPLWRPNLALVTGGRTIAVTKSESSTTVGICREGGSVPESEQTINHYGATGPSRRKNR